MHDYLEIEYQSKVRYNEHVRFFFLCSLLLLIDLRRFFI